MKLSKGEIKRIVAKNYPDLKEKEFNIFLSITEYFIHKNKEIILKSGRTDKTVFIILKGASRAYLINNKGIELNNHLRAEGFLLGEAKVFTDQAQVLDVEAIGETHILKFDINKLESLGFENTKIMKFYLAILKEIIVIFSHRIDTFVTMNYKERYLDLIKWNPLYLKSTFDKHLASFLGMTSLTFYRIKKKTKTYQMMFFYI